MRLFSYRRAGIFFVGTLIAALIAPTAVANHDQRTLEVVPETSTLEVGDTQLLTAILSSAGDVASGSINVDFENENGVNDADGKTLTTPDQTCTIPAGSNACSVSYAGTAPGEDKWRIWIDHDGLDSTNEADNKEASDETKNDGNGGPGPCSTKAQEPDCTDVITLTWVSGGGEALDCDDSHGTNAEQEVRPSGGGATSNESYACLVTDDLGNPTEDADPVAVGVQPIVVNAEIENGVNDPDAVDGTSYETPDYTCTAGEPTSQPAGSCEINLTQNENEEGSAQVCFWVGTPAVGSSLCSSESTSENQAADGSDLGNDLSDRVEISWEERSPLRGGIDVEPELDAGPLGQDHSLTITVFDQFGEPFVGDTVVDLEFFKGSPSDLDENSPGTPDLSCTTSNAPSCEVTIDQVAMPGTDLLCAWTNEPPAMAGTNNNGTCGIEGMTDADDDAGDEDAPTPRADDVDVVGRIWEHQTDAVTLDCFPEDALYAVKSAGAITCKALDGDGAPVERAEIDIEVTGANDLTEQPFVVAPDLSCVTGADGTCEILHGPGGFGRTAESGKTFYRAWIDDDNDNRSIEADATEKQADATDPGAQPEPDNTDVIVKQWTDPFGRCTILGTPGSDTILGTDGRDVVCGSGGDDTIRSAGGKDLIFGGAGADRLFGGTGNDRIDAGRGKDHVDGGDGSDVCSGGPGRDRMIRCEP